MKKHPLDEEYGPDCKIYEESDLARIKDSLTSKGITYVGQTQVGEYYQLQMCSPHRQGDKQLVIVCSMSNYEKAMSELTGNIKKKTDF